MKRFIVGYLVLAVLLTGLAVAWVARNTDNSGIIETETDAGSIVFFIDSDTGDILYANSAAIEFYGYTQAQLQQMTFMELNTDAETGDEAQGGIVISGSRTTVTHRLYGGDTRTLEVFAEPLTGAGGGSLLVTIQDITQRDAASQRQRSLATIVYIVGGGVILILLVLIWLLMRSYQRIQADKEEIENLNMFRQMFIDAGDNMVYLKDDNFCYLFANTATEKFYKKSKEEIIGHDDVSLAEETYAQMHRKLDRETLSKGSRNVSEILWEDRLFQYNQFPVPLTGGRTGVGTIIQDITQQRAQEKRREQTSHRNQILLNVFNRSFEDTQELLDYVLHESLTLTNSQYGYIYLYDEESEKFTLNSWTHGVMDDCSIPDRKTVYLLDETGLWGDAIRTREPVIVNDFQQPHPNKKGYPEGHVEIQTFMALPVIIDGEIVATIGLANSSDGYTENDISETTLLMGGVWSELMRREAHSNLAYERNRFLQTLLSIGDGVIVVDCGGTIDMINEVAEALTGWSLDDARGRHYSEVFTLFPMQDDQTINDPIGMALATEEIYHLSSQSILVSKDGSRYELEDSAAPIHDDNGRMLGAVMVFRDVTQEKEQQKEIEYLSLHDSLTGLYNRRFYEVEMQRLDTPRNLPLTVIMGDVNNLKLTNDIFGHEYGDALLKSIAAVFKRICRSDDIIARWGGDEFVLLLPQTGEEEAQDIIRRIKTEFAKEQIRNLKGSISMGYSIKSDPNEDIQALFSEAEENMYAVKSVENEKIQTEAMDAIIRSLNLLSEEDKRHATNVSALCTQIGRMLGLCEEDNRRLSNAGYLHDIGKITMDADLLYKSQPWTIDDRKIYRRHPLVGHRILGLFDPSHILAEAVLAHHENWDGTGYPKGTSGESIPLMARIISVAECFDRWHHNPDSDHRLSLREAIERIKDESGKKFDPRIAELFVALMEDKLNNEQEDG